MRINNYELKRLLIYLRRILLITGLLLGMVILALGLIFNYKTPQNQITVSNAVIEKDSVVKMLKGFEIPKPFEQQKMQVFLEGSQETNISSLSSEVSSEKMTERLTILLAGVDRRQGEESMSNTDTMIIAQLDPQVAQIRLLSVPRDTQVEIPGYGKGKISAVARLGKGMKTTKTLLEKVCGQPIDGYVLTNFAGFKDIIDTLGGINLTVEKDMYYVTGDNQDGVIDLKKGTQRLNGTQALQYARFRHDALADISRTIRQQTVLKALAKEFGQVKTLSKLPWLIPQVCRNVQTDLSIDQIWSLANLFTHFNSLEIVSQTLPGNFAIEKGMSYWKVNLDESHKVSHDFFTEGKTTAVFSRKVGSVQGSTIQKTLKSTDEINNQLTTQIENTTEQVEVSELPEFEFEFNYEGD